MVTANTTGRSRSIDADKTRREQDDVDSEANIAPPTSSTSPNGLKEKDGAIRLLARSPTSQEAAGESTDSIHDRETTKEDGAGGSAKAAKAGDKTNASGRRGKKVSSLSLGNKVLLCSISAQANDGQQQEEGGTDMIKLHLQAST